jgi:MtrB/PioB family decaheme-associated outer membrane protein
MTMMTNNSKLPYILTAVGAIALAPAVNAQAVDTSDWACEYCPFEGGHQGEYEIGATSVSDASAYFGNATGYDEDGVYANVDGQGSYASDKHRMRWTLEDLALDSRVAELDGGRQGKFDYNLAWRELPRREFLTTSTIFQQSGSDSLLLPAGWVNAPLTSGMTALDSSLVSRNIESDRRVYEIGGRYLPTNRFSFSANYRRQEKDGLNIYGGSTFTNASLLPMPFDYATDEVDIGVRYGGDNSFVSLSWYLSDFQNENLSLQWENPFTPTTGAETLAMAQAPDSEFSQITFAAGFSYPDLRTVMSLSASIGEITQSSALLPYTTNANVAADPLPRSALDGSIDTTNFALSVTSRLFEKARIKFSYRYDERDNSTPQDTWNRVITDVVVGGPELNIPYSFERSLISLSGDYDLFNSLRLSAGYDYREIERDFQEVASQEEDTGWGRVRWRPGQTVQVDVRGGAAKREVDLYDEAVAVSLGQNPLMRKYSLAYRYREFGELTFTWSPLDAPVSITVNGLYADDSYSQSQLGLTAGDELSLSGDFSWSFSEKGSLYVNIGSDSLQSEQAGSESFGAPDWRATNDDDFTTIGAGFRVKQIGENFDLQLDYSHSDGTSKINIASAAGAPDQFPDLTTDIDYLRLRLGYQRSERLGFDLSVSYQQFQADDWALQGVAPDTIPEILSLGAMPYDEDSVWIGIGFRYSM